MVIIKAITSFISNLFPGSSATELRAAVILQNKTTALHCINCNTNLNVFFFLACVMSTTQIQNLPQAKLFCAAYQTPIQRKACARVCYYRRTLDIHSIHQITSYSHIKTVCTYMNMKHQEV